MTTLFSIILALTSYFIHPSQTDPVGIELEITHLRNTNGQIGILVFDGEAAYPDNFKEAKMSFFTEIEGETSTFKISDLEAGQYVFTVMHDENENGEMDKTLFGKPTEGYGVSNNPKPRRFGPPKYKEGIITLEKTSLSIEIKMRYDD